MTDSDVDHNPNHALVVEGGSHAGYFCSWGFRCFYRRRLLSVSSRFIGVSAGSTNAIGYLSSAHKRSYRIITDHARRDEFMNIRRYLKGGHFLPDVSWLWHTSVEEMPINTHAFFKPQYSVNRSNHQYRHRQTMLSLS